MLWIRKRNNKGGGREVRWIETGEEDWTVQRGAEGKRGGGRKERRGRGSQIRKGNEQHKHNEHHEH